jgi:hypothetical protein
VWTRTRTWIGLAIGGIPELRQWRKSESRPANDEIRHLRRGSGEHIQGWLNFQTCDAFTGRAGGRALGSELELAPGLKGVAVANMSEIPAIIDRIIEVVNGGHFDAQMKQISDNLASKIKGGKGDKLQQAA